MSGTTAVLIFWLVFNVSFVALRLHRTDRRAQSIDTRDRRWRADTYASKLVLLGIAQQSTGAKFAGMDSSVPHSRDGADHPLGKTTSPGFEVRSLFLSS